MMRDRSVETELHDLDWHSFNSDWEGDTYVLYIQPGLQMTVFDPATAVKITGTDAEDAYANAVAYARQHPAGE